MKICNCTAKLALLALIAAGLLAVPPETQAQALPEERENYAWITNTDGSAWKKEIRYTHSSWTGSRESLSFDESDKPKIASILVPEHAAINSINVKGCVNLTNLVIQPARSGYYFYHLGTPRVENIRFREDPLVINAENSGLSNITCSKAVRNSIRLTRGEAEWWPIQWTELKPKPEPAPIEIRTHATANGPEVEVIWREGTLQIADAVSGEWRDHIGASPLRFPLLSAKDMQFYRIGRIESPTKEEPPTPQTLGRNR